MKMKSIIAIIASIVYSVVCSAQEQITLLFVGDLMQHKAQIEAARQADGSYRYNCFDDVKAEISGADLAIGNLEVTLGGKPYSGYPTFSAPDEFLQGLCEAGFDVLLTANNHCLDRGRSGLERTIALLDSAQIAHAGTYVSEEERQAQTPLILTCKGFKLALLNYTYGTNGLKVKQPNVVNYIDRDRMKADIAQARAHRPDAVIACMHWGVEYERLPNAEQRQLADWLLAHGVDHVIGSHPHVIQPMEVRQRGARRQAVVYSLGNFISNMSRIHTDGGLMVKLVLEKKKAAQGLRPICTLRDCSYSLVWTANPRLTGQKQYRVIDAQAPMSDLPQKAQIKRQLFAKQTETLLQQHCRGVSKTGK